MKNLKLELTDLNPLDEQSDTVVVNDVPGPGAGQHSTVSEIMNLGRAVQPEPEPNFFADMEPTYTAPKLL